MEEKQKKSLFMTYLRQYRFTVFMFLLYFIIYVMIFSLYSLETEAVLYAAGLCIILTVVVLSVHYIFYHRDHVERKHILKHIELSADRLPQPNTLAEADYEEMITALKQAYDANLAAWQSERSESMDYYMTWVHQIKTPISVMRMVLQSEDTNEHRELLAELFRIEQYVEMVLSYLRLNSESSDYVFQEYDLDQIIKQAVHKYASQFVRKRIRLVYEPMNVFVLTDEKWLLFIIEQLLSNAVKYTQQGTVTITVTPDKILKISDTGIGIASEDLPRIFEKGFTGYNGRADKKSTGLGLYLCKTAADRLSHMISVQSEVGKGTVFILDLHENELNTLS